MMKQIDFVSSAEQEAGKAGTTERKPKRRRRGSNGPREGHRRLTADIPADLHKRLKMQALMEECTVTDIIIEASRAWLASR
ncbi:MAG: hypothetical protein V2I38_06705 [Alcanivoracaceae bacterium]|nr:hypothetical protein [Alcanivoracaceae bacterium]